MATPKLSEDTIQTQAGTDFALVTLNMHKGISGDGAKSFILNELRDALAQTDADAVFLQETVGRNDAHAKRYDDWPETSQFEHIADTLWPHFAYGKNAHYEAGHHGNAILSKYALRHWDNIDVSPYPFAASRSLLHAIISPAPTASPLHLICVHLGFLAFERRGQIETLCAHIDEHIPHDEPLIVAGDFNDWRGIADREFDEQLELHEAYREIHGGFARSFPARAPMLRLDRVYYRGLQLINIERLVDRQWKKLSDHIPLRAVFRLT
ncbi:MAG: endonuclease/exonuclease/phosphatase family protein [Gammaproteobacteria bacterium]